jgi:hypothetical protein
MLSSRFHLKWVFVLLFLVGLAACSPQRGNADSSKPSLTPPIKTPSQSPTQPISTPTPAVVAPTTSSTVDSDQQVLKSYHTILMLERADDLMIAFVQKSQTGELPLDDAGQRTPYLQAFVVALDDFNQTTPPTPSILNHAWKTFSTASEQYQIVYNAVNQGQAISARDLSSMRLLRQLMKNYEDYAVGYLKAKGKDNSFFTSEHNAVEAHFKMSYGKQPIPATGTSPEINATSMPTQ